MCSSAWDAQVVEKGMMSVWDTLGEVVGYQTYYVVQYLRHGTTMVRRGTTMVRRGTTWYDVPECQLIPPQPGVPRDSQLGPGTGLSWTNPVSLVVLVELTSCLVNMYYNPFCVF